MFKSIKPKKKAVKHQNIDRALRLLHDSQGSATEIVIC